MRLPQLSIIAGSVLGGFVLGLILAPSLRRAEPANASSLQGTFAAANRTAASADAPGPSPARTRARDREPANKTDEPRISIPVKTMVTLLGAGNLRTASFADLEHSIDWALDSLGASQPQSTDIKNLLKKSKDEVYAAEKTHLKLRLITPDRIAFDGIAGIRQPVSDIIGRLQDGIRATLNSEAAEILISAIDWKSYYPFDVKSTISLEVKREPSGEFCAWVTSSKTSSSNPVDEKFPDDGTPLPADEIFPDLWKPFLKGLTLVPKDGK